MAQVNTTPCFKSAALHWHEFGFQIIPIIPGTKRPPFKWDPWLDGLSTRKIKAHWDRHPDHEIGFIVGDNVIVLDADSPQSIAALAMLEKTFDLSPNFTVSTAKGLHHYFKRASGTFARTDSHSTEEYPERIDVKTGRSLVVLPPSTGKEVDIDEAENASELIEASQEFIDGVFLHNGRDAPRLTVVKTPSPLPLPADMDQATARINAMLEHVDPDCGYDDWLHILMAIFHETGGSDDGFVLANAWSSKGSKYSGEKELRAKWDSFGNYAGTPVTIATLIKMAKDGGADVSNIINNQGEGFEPCEFETIEPKHGRALTGEVISSKRVNNSIVLEQFSLTGSSAELEAEALDQVYVLEFIALLGHWTVLYARHNTGKTLIVIYLLVETIRSGSIKASDIFYFNLDDTQRGLTEKLKIAEEMGFHVLCDGYRGFKVADFIDYIEELCRKNQARGKVLVLDTLKKFTDLMDKRRASRWGEVIRRFIAKGGTVIGLAHVNKNPGIDGKSIYAGTTDIIDDADCAYVLDAVSVDDKTHTKIVEFENRKRRGNVVNRVSYSFSIEDGLSYHELLASVSPVNESELVAVKQVEVIKSDTDIIDATIACINEGVNTKMRLRDAVSDRIGCSKRAAIKVIEKYTGADPTAHRWTFAVAERGKKVFSLLDPGTSPDRVEDSEA
ncbi:MAG: PriCT-2 domain-containing protein [Pseudomonadota bacterium]